jgi:DNA-binding SARP family transcriptional activator/tRNA A-37 threonylcarbamoyl transferase component Bud32
MIARTSGESTMAHLKLFVLGQPRLERDGRPIELNLRKALALLVYLAVSGQGHSRDALATMLWPESDGREGRARLRRTLHRLGQALGVDVLDAGPDAIRLAPTADLWLDCAAFRQHVAAGLPAPADPLAPQRLAHLEAATELYADDFLIGFTLPDSPAFDEWQFFVRESLRQLYGQVLEQLVQAHRSQQAWAQAIPYARKWVARDALHEPAHRALMRLYALAGQHAAALRQYQECARVLDAELGVAPEEETTALYEAIRTRQLAPSEAAVHQPLALPLVTEPQPHQRYLLEEHLAEGGQGEVYRGRDQMTGQPVAIKWLKTELADRHPDLVARFVREGAALRRLHHPNIVAILDTFEHAGRYAIVMEYVPGGSLRALLDTARQLPLDRVLAIGLELADALSRAHHVGVVHRDLKPENVLLAADGTPRLTDFGMARLEWDDARLTQSGTLFGSPAYMSPEAIRGEELDARSDIWSLGVVLYELLAGRRPFEGVQITPVLAAIQADPVPDLRAFRPDAPQPLVDLLSQMLVKERTKRIASMRQIAAALEAIRDGRAAEGILPEQRGQTHADEASVAVADTPSRADHATAHPLTSAGRIAPGALGDDSQPGAAEGPVFVAREQELGRLDALLDLALAAQSLVAFVVGEAGQGKTTLLQAFARRAMQAHPELIVAGGNCNAYTGAGDPYLPFREILELLTGDVEARALAGRLRREQAERLWNSLPATAQALLDVGPDLLDTFISARTLLSRAAASVTGGAAWLTELQALAESKATAPMGPQQQDLFEQYAKVVQHLARRAPLLLILDDLQWADLGSTNLLLHLGRRLKGCRVLIVGAYRPADVAMGRDGERHPLERVVGELRRDFGEIVLDLSRAEGRAFVDALLDSEPNLIDEAFRATLYQQTGGHPLFTIELLRDVQERGALVRDDAGRWVAAANLDWSSLPARVEGAIGERIGRLAVPLRELLQVASVEGEEFTAEVVAQVLGADEHEVVGRLSHELDQTHHLVQALGIRRAGAVRLSRYRFRHILIQRYLYGSLDDVVRAYHHEAVGHALEVLYGAQASEVAAQLAWHFEVAQLPEKAAVYHDQAGDQARRSVALDAAIHSYQTALEQWPTLDRAGRAALLRKLGECQWLTGQLQDALATFEACYALYESLGDREGAGAAQRLIGRMYWEQGNREQSLQHYHRALALLEQGPESVELARAISAISQMHMLASDYSQAISWGQRALTMAERLQAEHVMVPTLANMGNAYVLIGDAERGQAMLRRSWQRAVELNLPYDACRIAYLLGERKIDLGLSAEARAVFEELQTYATRMQMPLHAGLSSISLARLDWLTGRWQSALARREDILAWIDRSQSITYLEVAASITFAWMHNDLGQAEVARQILEQAQPKVIGRAEIQTTGPYLGQQVRALGMLGLEAEATQAARQFLLIEQQQDYWDSTMPHLAVCRWFASRAAEMREELKTSLALLERVDARLGSPATAAALSEGRGLVALSEPDALRTVDYLHQVAAQWQALGRPYDQARTLSDLGRALALAGDAGEARAVLDQALSLVEPLAAQLDAAEQKAAFLNSPLVQELRSAQSSVLAAPPRNLAP